MLVIGIVGGVASGKSLVARQLEACGADRIDGDRAGHEALSDPDVLRGIRERWGPEAIGPGGKVDRAVVAAKVFAAAPDGPRELEFLERLTHPQIETRLNREIERLAATGTPVAILDAAVLVKAGWNELCDRIVFVDAPRAVRWQRAQARGWSEEDFEGREASQSSLDEKRSLADIVIDNSGTLAATRDQVEQLWSELTASAG